MSGCGGGLSGAVSKGTKEEVADRRQEREDPSQGDEERLQSEKNDKLLIDSKQSGLTWAREDPTDPWHQDGPVPLTLIRSPWDYQWEELLIEVLPLSDRSPSPHPADLTTVALMAKLIQVALNLLPRPVSAPPDTVWVYTAEPPAPAPYPMHASDFLLHSAAVTEDLVKSLEGLCYSEGRRASGDPEILPSNRTTLGSPGNMRQLDQGTGCRKRQGSSLPSLRNETEGGYRPSLLRANNPGKATTPNTYGLDTPIKPRVAQPAFTLQPLLDPGSLLRVRAQIYTRLGGSEPESEDPGRKGLLPFLCPRPVRTLKVLAPLDGGNEERGMKLASRGSCPLKPIASWPTSSASRERKQWRSKPRSRALPVRKGGSEESSSSSLSSQASFDLEEQSEMFGMPLNQQEHEDAGDTVMGESYELDLPPSFIDGCNTSRPNLGAGAPSNNQDGNEQIMGDNMHVIYHTGWMDDCTVMPRGAETESSHIATPVSLGKTQNHCDVDLATRRSLSCEEEAWGDPEKAKYSKVLTEDDGRADEWHSYPKVPERSKDSHATACDDEARLAHGVPESKQHIRSVNTALSTGQLNEENRRHFTMLKNRDRDRCPSYHTNQSFNVLTHKEHNSHSRKSKRSTVTPLQKPANARRPSDLTIGGKSILEVGPQGAKASGKNTFLPSLWDKQVEPLRKNVTQSSSDRENLIRLEGTGQREPLQLEPMKAQQPKRSGILRAPRAKSAMECVTYNDMFLEINSQGEGPAIYEMFATPVYEKLRASSSYQRVAYRETKCAPARRNQGPKNNTYFKPPEIKPREYRREKSISTNAKQKRREDKVPRGKSHQVLISNTELESTISVSGLDCHIQTTKDEMIFCEEDKKSNPRVTPEEHVRKQALSIIEEVLTNSLAETSTFHCTPKDKSANKSAEVPIRPLKESFIPQITSYCSLRTHHIVQEPDENGLLVKIGEEKLEGTARSDEPRSVSFTTQPKIDYWTSGDSSRTVAPVLELLDAADEGAMTDDLLRCLAEELISLEEGEETGHPETSDSCKEEIVLTSRIKKGVTSFGGTCNISGSRTDDTILWTKGEVLGKGAYGTVYCGLTSHGQLIAVKQVMLDDTDPTTAKKEYQHLQDEVDLLKNLCHANIVGFLGTSLQDNVVSIFMEYVPGGSIASILQRFGPLPERVLALYTLQILQGVAYLHANRVIHRDLKGNNVMLMPTGIIKLIDFGCARRVSQLTHSTDRSEPLKSVHGTPYWMAPEVINETGHGRKSDVWSVGCTVFEMATGKPPLANMNKMAALFYIGARQGLMPAIPDRFSKEAQDFVQACLTRDQKERPSAQQLLAHPFVFRRSREGAPQPQS
ncbi:mitogen-activated protein kinase kinase kinase 19 isoform X2 [Brienomyrus brachyistius]|nr:mitogen-activated protein kinase kinase kinase 19 isoform X2 [Brienomyrus brachyistius]XP_048871906.1 mitogen-activated protein kinase kinase kinase 19 isoform X2 [Brienomyrus brachyistius]